MLPMWECPKTDEVDESHCPGIRGGSGNKSSTSGCRSEDGRRACEEGVEEGEEEGGSGGAKEGIVERRTVGWKRGVEKVEY